MTGDSIKTKIIVKIKNWCYSNDFLDFLKNKKTGKNSYPQFWWQFFYDGNQNGKKFKNQ